MANRSLAMVLYDPAAAAQQSGAKRPRPSAGAGAVVPYNNTATQPADVEPINAVPLSTIAPRLQPAPVRAEPPCLRKHILPALRLRADLPVHFIDDKRVTGTDLDPHQNRFRIPSDGALGRLRPILTLEELDSANLLEDAAPAPRKRQQPEPEPKPENGAAAADNEGGQKGPKRRKKKQGRAHGGLPVRLVDLAAGHSRELRLSRWDSSHGTVVKGEGYMDFIRRCSFKENDAVEIWAFKQRAFCLFGAPVFDESPLYVIIVKRDEQQPNCRYCRPLKLGM